MEFVAGLLKQLYNYFRRGYVCNLLHAINCIQQLHARRIIVVRLLLCLSISHNRELCINGWTDRDAVWDMDSGGRKEVYPHTCRDNFEGEKGPAQTCPDMTGRRYTQSDSAGGSTGTVRMPIGLY